MPIVLPKDLRGFRFPEAIPFELNGFGLETLLTPVFRLAVLEGRDSSRSSQDQSNIPDAASRFAGSDRMVGFQGVEGTQVLEKIVRTSLIRPVRNQRTKQVLIDGLIPYSIASFIAGFPTNASGFRQVDRFLYHLLLAKWNGDSSEVKRFFIDVFGAGVNVNGHPNPSVERRPSANETIDIVTELSINFAEVFEPVEPKRVATSYIASRPLPDFQNGFTKDLYRFLWSYRDRTPSPILIQQITALIGFELTIFTLKLMNALPELFESREVVQDAMMRFDDAVSRPQVYVDFTGELRGLSRSMANACLRRDLLSIDPFMFAVYSLRYLEGVVQGLRKFHDFRNDIDKYIGSLSESDTPKYLLALLELLTVPDVGPEIHREARGSLKEIRASNQIEADPDSDATPDRPESDVERMLNQLDAQGLSPIDQVWELLFRSQASKSRDNISNWIRSVGGVGEPWGLIHGPSDRRTWSYAPGNDLLTVLIQLRGIDYTKWNPDKGAEPRAFGVQEFLEWLEDRFGILVDRPPDDLGFDSPEHVAAAQGNLRAMLRRLRQMGFFVDQSDDFSVQRLTPAFATA